MELPHSLKRLYKMAAHHWLTASFILGFIVDNITLNRVDSLFDDVLLFFYVLLAMVSIVLLYAGIAERYSERTNAFLKSKAPIVMQYAFGSILSGMLIFYGRSGSFFDSWPFLVLIVGVILGNETITNRANRLVYNLIIFYIGLFSFVVLIVPVLIGKMGAVIFVLSGLLSLILMGMLVRTLAHIVPNFIALEKKKLIFFVGTTFVLFNALYFTNIIPPIPLSLKDIGIYHSVIRFENGHYELAYEKPAWWEFLRRSDSTFHYGAGDNVFCYASVFAPARLAVDVYHRWQYYDESAGEWKDYGRFAYPIQGGRYDGYRGYTQISHVAPGDWRCVVETERGQVIGKREFTVEEGPARELVRRTD